MKLLDQNVTIANLKALQALAHLFTDNEIFLKFECDYINEISPKIEELIKKHQQQEISNK